MKAVGREVKRSILFLAGLREPAKGFLDGFLIYFIKYNLTERLRETEREKINEIPK